MPSQTAQARLAEKPNGIVDQEGEGAHICYTIKSMQLLHSLISCESVPVLSYKSIHKLSNPVLSKQSINLLKSTFYATVKGLCA